MGKPYPVSIRTVAERAGVSTATVSNVLNGKQNVSAAFAARVRGAVDDLGYVADSNASRLRSGKRALAGVVVPDLTNPMFATFVSTLERAARLGGFDLLVVSSANDAAEEAERLSRISSWRPAGLIVIPCDGALSRRRPKIADLPIVVADRIPDDDAFDLIVVDNARASGAIAAHLADQGCRSCLVVGSTLSFSNVRERWEGARAAAGRMEIAMLEVGLDAHAIRRGMRERLSSSRRPAALFTLDQVTTLAGYEALREAGAPIGDDIAFASFDDTEWMRLVSPGITAVRQPVERMARAAWAQLMHRVTGGEGPPTVSRLSCAIEIRGSTLRRQSTPESSAA